MKLRIDSGRSMCKIMRYGLPLLGMWILLMTVAGCTKNEVKVSYQFPSDVNSTYIMLYYASDVSKGMIRESVAVVQQGKSEVTLPCVNPMLIYLSEGSRRLPVVIYAQRGDNIQIKGSNTNTASWSVDGNQINEALTDFRKQNIKGLEQKDGLLINNGVEKYVRANPESGASALILLVYYDRSIDPMGFENCWKMLKGDALDGKWRDLVSRSDMSAGYEPLSRKVGNVVLKTAYKGADTIYTDKAPSIFYFSNLADIDRDSHIRILREILKSRKDSASINVVEVSLEPDSTTWMYRISQDSLKGAVRAWMPKSFSDSLANVFNLSSRPWFVITAKGGKVLYAGKDADKAAKELNINYAY